MRARRQEPSEEQASSGFLKSLFGDGESWWSSLRAGFRDGWIQFLEQNASVILLALASLGKATVVTVKTGHTGLLFSFGRVKQEIPPGPRFLIPFLQVVRTLPTRQRTMDLPAQRVTTMDGLVYLVDANLVYRVVDVRKALIEIDDLVKGMRQVLVLSVQDVLRQSARHDLRIADQTDRALADAMAPLLESWGVELIHAGLTSITPSPATLSLVQLGVRVDTRSSSLARLVHELPEAVALPLLGTHQRVIRRSQLLAEREISRRRYRRVRRLLRREVQKSHVVLSPKEHRQLSREIRVRAGMAGILNG